ncbi:MAG: hypothetical protein AAGA30_00355 [Planctomycetota bacterium]
MSGTYGALHNQVTYSVSPEYFTQLKFEQFGIAEDIPHRYGAALVGWLASWWMGLVIGGILLPAGFLIRENRDYFVCMFRAYFLVLMTTFAFGAVAYFLGYLFTPESTDEMIFRGIPISDSARFSRAKSIHNASYLGGLIGIFGGLASILRRFLYLESRGREIDLTSERASFKRMKV